MTSATSVPLPRVCQRPAWSRINPFWCRSASRRRIMSSSEYSCCTSRNRAERSGASSRVTRNRSVTDRSTW